MQAVRRDSPGIRHASLAQYALSSMTVCHTQRGTDRVLIIETLQTTRNVFLALLLLLLQARHLLVPAVHLRRQARLLPALEN